MTARVRGFGPVVAALTIGAAIVLSLAACGGTSTPSTTAASTLTTTKPATAASTLPTSLPATSTTVPTTCSPWGKSFGATFNRGAKKQGNPERMLTVCCAPKNAAGVNHCVLTLTLAGTTSRGCEVIDLDDAGTPVSVGRKIACTMKA